MSELPRSPLSAGTSLLRGPINQAVVIQVVLVAFALGIGDAGITLLAVILSSVVFWLCAWPIMARERRQCSPTPFERIFVRWGLLLLVIVGTPAFVPWVILAMQRFRGS